MQNLTLEALVKDPPLIHRDQHGNPICWGLSEKVLHYIHGHTNSQSSTLETGAGLSTIVFALKGTNHNVIVPSAKQATLIKEFCSGNGIAIDNLKFHIGESQNILPNLNVGPLDLVLIDGAHRFPIPFIDFYYTGMLLKLGGKTIIDDTQIWTGQILKDFLQAQPEWRLVEDFPITCVFEKVSEAKVENDWKSQPYVVTHSKLRERKV
jgi:hypothetical protein